MSNSSCAYETLASNQYCRLSICRHCGAVNLNLPYRISLQFEIKQFLELADAFSQGAQQIRKKKSASSDTTQENVIELKKVLH